MTFNPTQAQRTAIETVDRNLIVVAGAGSGKTHVLTDRYMALLEANPDWPLASLVAITFTRKAAGEMRKRVRDKLGERYEAAQGNPNVAERERWAALLRSVESARIDTIHGLCATILRANAAQAGIDPGFEILDETGTAILLDAVVDGTLEALAEGGGPELRLFEEYARRDVRDMAAAFVTQALDDLPDDLLDAWRGRWYDNATAVIHTLRADDAFRSVGAWQLPDGADKLLQQLRDAVRHVETLLAIDDLETCYDALSNLAAITLRGGSQKFWGADFEDAKAARRAVRDAARNALAFIGEPPDGPSDQRAADLLPLWVGLIRRVQRAYAAAKTERGQLDFNDLETLTCNLFMADDSVRARYQGAAFKHLLVDEFQDTNAAQWEIIRNLADVHRPGSLFVVGDPKQSIYAFHGADVSVFGRVSDEITAAGGLLVNLARSFRTHAPLVAVFNGVFGRILTKDPGSPVQAYQIELGQAMDAFRSDAPAAGPAFELLLVTGTEQQDDDNKLSADDKRKMEARAVARHLQEMVAAGVQVADKNGGTARDLNFGDIAILSRSMRQIAIYENVFKAVGLPYVTVGGRGYYDRQEVWDVLNLLKALHNPADSLSLAAALRSPLFGLSDDALLALRLERREMLWEALATPTGVPHAEQGTLREARAILADLRALSGRMTVADLLREALAQTGYLATLSGLPDGARRRGNVEKLLEIALSSGKVTLGAFTEYLRDLGGREVREGEAATGVEGHVTVMSVHASKGLEFPLVVILDAARSIGGGRRSSILRHDPQFGLACKVIDPDTATWAAKQPFIYGYTGHLDKLRDEAESKRLLYVAATRAQDYLIVSGWAQVKDNQLKTGGWLEWLADALDIDRPTFAEAHVWQDGSIRARLVAERPDDMAASSTANATAWMQPAVQQGQLIPGVAAAMPLLLGAVKSDPAQRPRNLTATQIAHLGSDDAAEARRFRQAVFHGVPAVIRRASTRWDAAGVYGWQLGNMVHHALQLGRLPAADDDLDALLRTFAWDEGIIAADGQRVAIEKAREMLAAMQASQLYAWLQDAAEIYRELPFVYRQGGRVIHGVIDVLWRNPDGSWALADYKTSYVEGGWVDGRVNRAALEKHARRFYLQVGVYAAAVKQRVTDIEPEVYIHYIRYRNDGSVHVPAKAWGAALNAFDGRLFDVVSEML